MSLAVNTGCSIDGFTTAVRKLTSSVERTAIMLDRLPMFTTGGGTRDERLDHLIAFRAASGWPLIDPDYDDLPGPPASTRE